MKDKNFDKQFGIDPRQKSNIGNNGKNLPEGIDWDILAKAVLKGNSPSNATIWGKAVNQDKDLRDFRDNK